MQVVGIYDPAFAGGELVSLPVWRDWGRVPPADAYLITGLEDPLTMYGAVAERAGGERVLVPRVLGLDAAINNP